MSEETLQNLLLRTGNKQDFNLSCSYMFYYFIGLIFLFPFSKISILKYQLSGFYNKFVSEQ